MFRVLITDNLSPAGLKILNDTPGIETDIRSGLSPEEVKEALKEADGIIIRSGTKLTPELLEGQERLKVIVRAGVGVDNIDLPAATHEGIVVMNTPAGNTTSTAEHAIALMMSLSRNIGPASASMNSGKWDRKLYTGSQVSGKTLAIVGLGRIGLSVAKRAQGLEMKVIGYDPFLSPERAAELDIELYRDVDEIIPLCDYLTVHTPLTDETRGLINKERFAKMKSGARVINCARGGIIDEQDLVDAIEAGQIAGAALDVYTTEPAPNERLVSEDRILKTPHLGASTTEAQDLVAIEAADIISGYLLRNEIRYAINMAPISGTEMEDMRTWLDLTHRLGLLLAQLNKGGCVNKAKINYRGDISTKKTKLLTSSFATGLLEAAMNDSVNIVNAEVLAHDRGIEIVETSSQETNSFSSMVTATIETADGTLTAAGTKFGNDFVRLVRLDDFPLEAFLDGVLLIYRHRDVPGLIGFIGTVLGENDVNIANMALGRSSKKAGGDSIAVLNLDSEPNEEALKEILDHQEVTGVQIVKLPPADDSLPWMECE